MCSLMTCSDVLELLDIAFIWVTVDKVVHSFCGILKKPPIYWDRLKSFPFIQSDRCSTNPYTDEIPVLLSEHSLGRRWLNLLHQSPHQQHDRQQLVGATITVRWAVFTVIPSVKWLSKRLDKETIIAGTMCARASSVHSSSPKQSEQSTIPTQKRFN